MVWSGVEFHFSLRATRDWKSESVTYGQTWVGARDTCVSKNELKNRIDIDHLNPHDIIGGRCQKTLPEAQRTQGIASKT